MPIEVPPLQTRATNAVREENLSAQNEIIYGILAEGVTTLEYLRMRGATTSLKGSAQEITSRLAATMERAKALDEAGKPDEAAALRQSIASDEKLVAGLETFATRLSQEVSAEAGIVPRFVEAILIGMHVAATTIDSALGIHRP